MKFTKMQGAGNDFLVINNIEEKLPQAQFAALALCTVSSSFVLYSPSSLQDTGTLPPTTVEKLSVGFSL